MAEEVTERVIKGHLLKKECPGCGFVYWGRAAAMVSHCFDCGEFLGGTKTKLVPVEVDMSVTYSHGK